MSDIFEKLTGEKYEPEAEERPGQHDLGTQAVHRAFVLDADEGDEIAGISTEASGLTSLGEEEHSREVGREIEPISTLEQLKEQWGEASTDMSKKLRAAAYDLMEAIKRETGFGREAGQSGGEAAKTLAALLEEQATQLDTINGAIKESVQDIDESVPAGESEAELAAKQQNYNVADNLMEAKKQLEAAAGVTSGMGVSVKEMDSLFADLDRFTNNPDERFPRISELGDKATALKEAVLDREELFKKIYGQTEGVAAPEPPSAITKGLEG